METVLRSVTAMGSGERGMNRWSSEDFKGNKTILYDTIIKETCHYTFVQMHRVCNTKSNPKVKDELQF